MWNFEKVKLFKTSLHDLQVHELIVYNEYLTNLYYNFTMWYPGFLIARQILTLLNVVAVLLLLGLGITLHKRPARIIILKLFVKLLDAVVNFLHFVVEKLIVYLLPYFLALLFDQVHCACVIRVHLHRLKMKRNNLRLLLAPLPSLFFQGSLCLLAAHWWP